jgi:hypothetical protein
MEVSTVPQDNSELLCEGIHSYRKVLFAVGEFRREMQERIQNLLNPRLKELALAMTLPADRIKNGLALYANPGNIRENFDGSYASVGLCCARQDQPWTLYVNWYVDETTEFGRANVSLWLRAAPRERAIRKLESIDQPGWETAEGEIYVAVPLEGNDGNAVDVAFNIAIERTTELWRKAGGVDQFFSEDTPPTV